MSHPSSFTIQRTLRLLACLLLGTSSTTQAATLTWSGAGANDNWSTTANWGGSAPVAGDVVTFGGMTRLSPVNDLAAGTENSGILFPNNYAVGASGAFSVLGASFILGGNITATAAAVTGGPFTIADSIANDIVINATRTITTASAGTSTTQMLRSTFYKTESVTIPKAPSNTLLARRLTWAPLRASNEGLLRPRVPRAKRPRQLPRPLLSSSISSSANGMVATF